MLKSDGTPLVRRLGVPRDLRRDLYHHLISLHWWQIALLLLGMYVSISLLFAFLYLAGGPCVFGARPGHLLDYFYFSVQTLATIGYGVMHPIGDYANLLVSLEAFCGLLVFALMTGLIFAKFSVPTARVIFARSVVLGKRDGKPALMFKMANARGNQIVEAQVKLTLNRVEPVEGDPNFRRFRRLDLVVSESPLFVLMFIVTHIIDEKSPLYGMSLDDMQRGSYNFSLTLMGLDAQLSQMVHARHNYRSSDIVENHRFADTLQTLPQGGYVLDYRRFHEVVPYA